MNIYRCWRGRAQQDEGECTQRSALGSPTSCAPSAPNPNMDVRRAEAAALFKGLNTQTPGVWKWCKKLFIFLWNMDCMKSYKFNTATPRPICEKRECVMEPSAFLAICSPSLAWGDLVSWTENCLIYPWHCVLRHLVFYFPRDICKGQDSGQKKSKCLLGKDLKSGRFYSSPRALVIVSVSLHWLFVIPEMFFDLKLSPFPKIPIIL